MFPRPRRHALPVGRGRRAFVLILLLLVASACTGDGPIVGVVPEDAPLPSIRGETLDGATASTDDLAGAPSVLNVWATWCDPCREELPELVGVAEAYEGRVGFLGLNYGDQTDPALEWERDYGIPYPSIEDPSGSFVDDLGFPYLPHTLVVDREGTIRYRIYGPTTSEQLSDLLDALLAEPASSS